MANVWLAENLRMGAPDGGRRYVSEVRQGKRKEAKRLAGKITNIRV